MPDPITGLTAEECYDHPPCHAEGCRWEMTDEDGCGLVKIFGFGFSPDIPEARMCAARIVVDAWIADGEFSLD